MAAVTDKLSELESDIKVVDMQKPMIQEAMRCAQQAIDSHEIEEQIARHIKEQFDRIYYPNWHCIVGKSFATVVTYESRHYIHFRIAQRSVVLFKFG